MSIKNSKEFFNNICNSVSKAYHDADARYREQERQRQLQQIFQQACNDYFTVAGIVADVIRNNPDLDMLPPGDIGQLLPPDGNGVGVTKNGIPVFRVIVKCAAEGISCSPRAWGKKFQSALDRECYSNSYPRLVLLKVTPLPGGYFELILTWGRW